MAKLLSIFFLTITGFLLIHGDDWKPEINHLFNIISKAVAEYFIVFDDLFKNSFDGTLNLIDHLVSEYFETIQLCYNHTLDILEKMIDKYLDLLKFLIQNLVGVPNSWVYTFGLIAVTYILKN
tara:strand:+ start:339 stop:707 length:369 start_codon:yes stop_codon:yes gene_type:complete